MLLTYDLDVDVLHGVTMQGCRGAGVADPEIDCVGIFLEGYPGKGNVSLGVLEERDILVSEVVVFWKGK